MMYARRKRRRKARKRRKHAAEDLGIEPTATPTADSLQRAIESPSAETLTPNVVQSLQTTHGNAFVQQLVQQSRAEQTPSTGADTVIQRMPTREEIAGNIKIPKGGKYIIGKKRGKQKSANFLAIITAIDAFHTFPQPNEQISKESSPGEINKFFRTYAQRIGAVTRSVEVFLDGKSHGKAAGSGDAKARLRYIRDVLQPQALKESSQINETIAQARPLMLQVAAQQQADLDKDNRIAEYGGGNNKVYEFAEGFFKANTESFQSLESIQEELDAIQLEKQRLAQQLNPLGEKLHKAKNGEITLTDEEARQTQEEFDRIQTEMGDYAMDSNKLINEKEIPDEAGIERDAFESSNREVASSRLDQLLGTSLITRAQFALERDGEEATEGVLMEAAKGTSFAKLATEGNVTGVTGWDNKTVIGQDAGSNTVIDVNDGNFKRQLSMIQLLDNLAFQVDRNWSNFYVQLDASGRVVSLKGIDNDLAFGTRTDIDTTLQQYPGLTRFVDRDMGERILQLDPALLRLAMQDLLSADELDALTERLSRLQAHIQELKDADKLLDPADWDKLDSAELEADQNSYYSKMYFEARKALDR